MFILGRIGPKSQIKIFPNPMVTLLQLKYAFLSFSHTINQTASLIHILATNVTTKLASTSLSNVVCRPLGPTTSNN